MAGLPPKPSCLFGQEGLWPTSLSLHSCTISVWIPSPTAEWYPEHPQTIVMRQVRAGSRAPCHHPHPANKSSSLQLASTTCTYLSTSCVLGTSCVPGTMLTASHSPSRASLSTAWKEGSSALPSHGKTEDLEVKALPQSHPSDPRHSGGDTQTTPSSHCCVCGMWFSGTSRYNPHCRPFPNPSWPLFTCNQCHVNIRDRLLHLEAGATWLADTQPCPREGLGAATVTPALCLQEPTLDFVATTRGLVTQTDL